MKKKKILLNGRCEKTKNPKGILHTLSCLRNDATMPGFIRAKAEAHTHSDSRVKDRARGLALLTFSSN